MAQSATMEEFEALLNDSFEIDTPKEGSVVKGKIIAIVTEGDEQVKQFADDYIEIPETNEYLVPLIATVPFQILSYYIAVMRECNVDQPRNLAKSVTVE